MMRNLPFDWRWIVLIATVLLLVYARSLPWPIVALGLGGGGGYLLQMGWRIWTRSSNVSGGRRVTYWRGERIEMKPERGPALPRLSDVGPAAIYLLIGGIMVLAAASIVFNQLGFR
jgi:hypothetical protein